MKLARKVGATSQIFQVFIRDSSSTTGAGLTGLVFNTASLTAYYHRDTDTTATAITLVTMTVGTFTSSGFKEIDATNMPGWYQFCPPNAALASGAASVTFHLKGATNMAPLPIEVDLDAQVDVTFWNGTVVATPATAGIPDVNAKNIGGTSQTGRDIGASVLLSAGTGTGQLDFTSGIVKSNLNQILGTALTETAGQIAAAFKQFFNIASPTSTMNVITAVTTTTTATNLTNAPTAGDFTATMKTSLNASTPASITGAVGSVTSGVTVSTNNDKTGYSLTQTFPTNFSSLSIDGTGNVKTQTNVKKNAVYNGFTFLMTDSTTHTPKTGLTVTAQRSIDGAALAACTNTATEISVGLYTINLSAADTNGNNILLRFTATGADDQDILLITNP